MSAGRYQMYNNNSFKLGLFGANCSSGRAINKLPERWLADWDSCATMAKIADDAGIDFILPIGRWKGYGGPTNFQGTTYETVTWATGLLAQTSRITIFGTVHAPMFTPLVAAKQMVTADHIGKGRFALNVVVGWNEPEFDMFGEQQRPHETRYQYAEEWISAIKKMWTNPDAFDVNERFLHLKNVVSEPKPFNGTTPFIMNAAASDVGRNFALHHCHGFFTSFREFDVQKATGAVSSIKKQALDIGRHLTGRHVINGPPQFTGIVKANRLGPFIGKRNEFGIVRLQVATNNVPVIPQTRQLGGIFRYLHGMAHLAIGTQHSRGPRHLEAVVLADQPGL